MNKEENEDFEATNSEEETQEEETAKADKKKRVSRKSRKKKKVATLAELGYFHAKTGDLLLILSMNKASFETEETFNSRVDKAEMAHCGTICMRTNTIKFLHMNDMDGGVKIIEAVQGILEAQ